MPDKIAVLSDIHGNRFALEAVLDHISRLRIDTIVNLGDSLYGPLDPVGTAQLLMHRNILSVCGNEDRIILEPDTDSTKHESLPFVKNSLSATAIAWISSLEMRTIAFEKFLLFHGTPWHDDRYFLYEIYPYDIVPRDSGALLDDLRHFNQSVILCGHDHTPRIITLPDQKLLINPGSVGLPAYVDYSPFPHKMESGSPEARFAVLSCINDSWRAEIVQVPYDWHTAAELAAANGRPDWVPWLSTGQADTPPVNYPPSKLNK